MITRFISNWTNKPEKSRFRREAFCCGQKSAKIDESWKVWACWASSSKKIFARKHPIQYHNRHQDFSQIWNYYQYSWVWVQLGPQLSVTQIVKWEFSICCRILVLVESEFFELGSLLWRLIYTGDFRAFLQAQCPRSFSCVADGQEIAPGSYKDYDKCQTINCYCNPRVKHDSLDSPTARVEACQLSYSYGVVLVLS